MHVCAVADAEEHMCIPARRKGKMTSRDPVEVQMLPQHAAFLPFPSDIPAQCGGHVHCGCLTGGEAASTRGEEAKGQNSRVRMNM